MDAKWSGRMADHRVDLLILDVMLPGEDGLSLCRKVRSDSQMPIIMLTARGEDVTGFSGWKWARTDYLAKRSIRANCWPGSMRLLRRQAAAQTVSATNWRDRPHLFWDGGSISGCGSCAIRRGRGLR